MCNYTLRESQYRSRNRNSYLSSLNNNLWIKGMKIHPLLVYSDLQPPGLADRPEQQPVRDGFAVFRHAVRRYCQMVRIKISLMWQTTISVKMTQVIINE